LVIMSRSRAISIALVASSALGAAAFAGCNLGSVAPANGFMDGSQGGSDTEAGMTGGPPTACINKQAAGPDGNHNAGMACITSACHLAGQLGAGAPAMIIGGTLYTDSTATTGAVGATVYIPDGANTYTLVTSGSGTLGSGAGNFYVFATGSETSINGGGSPIATSCPSLMGMAPMTLTKPADPSTLNDGNCNRGGCHSLAASQDGPAMPMHL
jgi:hypothetical protein